MTGPEHYAEAERLLEAAHAGEHVEPLAGRIYAEAQVHATLALAAATIDAGTSPRFSYTNSAGEHITYTDAPNVGAWERVLS